MQQVSNYASDNRVFRKLLMSVSFHEYYLADKDNLQLSTIPPKQQLYGHLPPISKTDVQDMREIAGEERASSIATFSCGLRELIYNSSLQTQD